VNGAWYLAYHHSNRFAALLVVSGFIEEFTGTSSGTHYPPIVALSAGDAFAAVAKNVRSLPIWTFHGYADRTVSVEQSRQMFSALKAAGANVQYTELPGVPHNAWDSAYDRADVFTWLFQQRRR
jgi:predicted peptidase